MFGYTVEGFSLPDFNWTFALSDEVANTDSLEGLAVEQDTAHANTVKLATDGGKILGFILVAEDGKSQGEGITVTVSLKGGHRVASSAELAVGDHVVGAGAGKVKKDTANASGIVVFEAIDANTAVVLQK